MPMEYIIYTYLSVTVSAPACRMGPIDPPDVCLIFGSCTN